MLPSPEGALDICHYLCNWIFSFLIRLAIFIPCLSKTIAAIQEGKYAKAAFLILIITANMDVELFKLILGKNTLPLPLPKQPRHLNLYLDPNCQFPGLLNFFLSQNLPSKFSQGGPSLGQSKSHPLTLSY